MKLQISHSVRWLVLLFLFAVALLPASTTPMAAQGPLPDKFLFAIGSVQAPVGQFKLPKGVAVASDSTVYVADTRNHRIQRFSTTGQFLGILGSQGSGDGQFGGPLDTPNGVAVAPDGTVYVADTSDFNYRIQRFSTTGQFLGTWGSWGRGDGEFGGLFDGPRGMAVAPDGTVYVADTYNHRIQYFSATGQFLGKWGSWGSGDGQFAQPEGVAVAPDGTVYVADTYNHRIQYFSATGQFLGKWGSPGSDDRQFKGPYGVAVAPDSTVYVADTENHHIQRFSATGQFLGKWGSQGSGDGQFDGPTGVAVAPDGTVYVADTGNHHIQRFSATGQFLGKWGSQNSGDEEFGVPWGVAVAANGMVYVADMENYRIQRFSAMGQFLGKWGSEGSGDGQFVRPSGVAVAPDGTVYVADSSNDHIQRFSAVGQFLGKWGSSGNGDGQFWWPGGVAVASDRTVYVADTVNRRIQRFSTTGQFLGKWGSYGSGDGQFDRPSGMAVAPDGKVYVADYHRIQYFSAIGRFLGKWGSEGNYERECEFPDEYTVGQMIWRSNASSLQVYGQFGTTDAPPWPAKSGYVKYVGINLPQADHLYLRVRYSKYSPPSVPIHVYIDDEPTPRASFYPEDQGDWNRFAWTDAIDLGNVDGGIHSIKFYTDGQQYGVADLDKFTLTATAALGHVHKPSGVAVALDSTVYVVDIWNHRIQRFSATGQLLDMWGSPGSGDGDFNNPGAVAVAPDGTVYVADTDNHRIQRFSATGQFLDKWGSYGSGDGQFSELSGVAVAPDGMVYVADSGNDRIQRFSATGQFLGKWGSWGWGNGEFIGPSGVAVALDGTVYVADTLNPRIQRFSTTGTFLGKWGSYGSGDGQFNEPYGVAVAPAGTVYVTDRFNDRVQAFGPAYPATWRGEFFANRWLAERPLVISQTAEVDFDWGTGAPDPALPADGFSTRFQRYVSFKAGTYRFTVQADDGVRLWVDGRLLVDRWEGPAGTYSAALFLAAGDHPVRLEYNDVSGPAAVHLRWEVLLYLPLVTKGG